LATDTRSRVTADPFRCDAGNYGEMGRALTEQLTGESCARNCARRRGTRGNSARKPHLKTNSLGVHSHPESHPERTHNPLVEGSNPSGPTSVPDQALPRISVVDSHLRQQPRRHNQLLRCDKCLSRPGGIAPSLHLRNTGLAHYPFEQFLSKRAHYADAGAAKLSGDRSQFFSDAPLTGLAGPVEIPSLRIFVMRVVRLSPSLVAAPFGPPTSQLV